jgi:hypothetical protein
MFRSFLSKADQHIGVPLLTEGFVTAGAGGDTPCPGRWFIDVPLATEAIQPHRRVAKLLARVTHGRCWYTDGAPGEIAPHRSSVVWR